MTFMSFLPIISPFLHLEENDSAVFLASLPANCFYSYYFDPLLPLLLKNFDHNWLRERSEQWIHFKICSYVFGETRDELIVFLVKLLRLFTKIKTNIAVWRKNVSVKRQYWSNLAKNCMRLGLPNLPPLKLKPFFHFLLTNQCMRWLPNLPPLLSSLP